MIYAEFPRPFVISRRRKFSTVQYDLKRSLEIEGLLGGIVGNKMPGLLRDHYKTCQANASFGQKKKIGGREEVLLGAQEISECYQKAAQQSINTLPSEIQQRFSAADNELLREHTPAEEDMAAVFTSRQERLKETVDYYASRLLDNYSIPFPFETPIFAFEFTKSDTVGNVEVDIRAEQDVLRHMTLDLANALQNAPLAHKNGSLNLFQRLVDLVKLKLMNEKDISPIYYNVNAFLSAYQEDISYGLRADLSRQHYERTYQATLNRAVEVRRNYFDSIQKQMDEESRQMQNFADRVYNMLDITGKLDMEKQQIEEQREDLERVQRAVSELKNGWSNVRPEP